MTCLPAGRFALIKRFSWWVIVITFWFHDHIVITLCSQKNRGFLIVLFSKLRELTTPIFWSSRFKKCPLLKTLLRKASAGRHEGDVTYDPHYLNAGALVLRELKIDLTFQQLTSSLPDAFTSRSKKTLKGHKVVQILHNAKTKFYDNTLSVLW